MAEATGVQVIKEALSVSSGESRAERNLPGRRLFYVVATTGPGSSSGAKFCIV
jgi:hypothetical protein